MAEVITSTPVRNEECEINNNQENRDEITKIPTDAEDWLKPDANVNDYQFFPHQFIRSHCMEQTANDDNIQIWDVVFEPGNPEVIATCGGRFLCVINVNTGELLLKYCHKNKNQDFYTLSWTTTAECGNLLASGSSHGEIRLYHLAKEVSIYSWVYKKGVSVNAAQFHSYKPTLLFTASKDSVVNLWDIGNPCPPYYEDLKHVHLLSLQATGGDLYSMAWVPESNWILVGAMEGLMAWKIVPNKLKTAKKMIEFRLPVENGGKHDPPYVDSVASLGNNLVATKCVSQGRILIFRPPSVDAITLSEEGDAEVNVEILAQLAWRKTTNFYMNIGGLASLCLVGCGDDRGNVWVYKLPDSMCSDLEENGAENKVNSSRKPLMIAPLGILPWPDLEDESGNVANSELMMDKVAFAPNGQFVVAVTNNNLVAIWKRIQN